MIIYSDAPQFLYFLLQHFHPLTSDHCFEFLVYRSTDSSLDDFRCFMKEMLGLLWSQEEAQNRGHQEAWLVHWNYTLVNMKRQKHLSTY